MLYKLEFHLSGKVGTPRLDNSTAKIHLCNQQGIITLFAGLSATF